jgi:hypothetical protein
MRRSLRAAMVISLSLALIDLTGESAAFSSLRWFKWLPFVIMTGMLVYECAAFHKRTDLDASTRSVFRQGLRITLITSCMLTVYRLLFLYILFPATAHEVLHQLRSAMGSEGIAHQPGMDSFMATIQKFFVPFALLGSFLTTMFCGVIASGFGSLYCKYRTASFFLLTKSNDELCKQKP